MLFGPLMTYLAQTVSWAIDTFSLEPRHLASPDRAILEEIILPYFANNASFQRILFVGCSAYTQKYEEMFRRKEYWTIDAKRVKRKYGAKRHIVDSITSVEGYISGNYFDVIIMNGVIGYGLDQVSDIERAIEACRAVLVSQGILLIGWNDTPRRTPIDIRTLRAIGRLGEYCFEPLQTCHHRTEGALRHTFSFYRKV
jgi:hypothetical protein